MKRETRINLLFVGLFLVISLPGAVILFRKKLDPNASRMDQPDAIVRQLPYMAPPPAPPGMKWVVPPKTRQWLIDLNHRFGSGDDLLTATDDTTKWQPVISEDHILQVVSVSHSESMVSLSLLIWEPSLNGVADAYSFNADAGVRSFAGQVLSCQKIAVPADIKRELMGLNMIRPPAKVTWMAVEFPGLAPTLHLAQLRMDYHGPGGPRRSAVQLP